MTFLAPLFLLGALAVALPVVFHLIRRTTRQRTVFSSLMFLLPTPPRLTRRSRLEDLLLLALRCLVLCLLALGFARPFLKKAVGSDPPTAARRLVVLVDTSASMQRPNLWADARAKAESILRKTSPADQVALFAFDRSLTPLLTFEQWLSAPAGERVALALRRLSDTSPGWSATHLGQALVGAAEALADTPGKPTSGPRQIVLISDLQAGSRLDQLQGHEWPKGLELSLELLKPKHPGNAGLQLALEAEEGDRKPNPSLRLRVDNASDSAREQFKVGWAAPDGRSFLGTPLEAYVPAGQSRIVLMPLPTAPPPSDRLLLLGDDEDFDNSVFFVPPATNRLDVLYLGAESPTDPRQPLYFLERAFQETRRQAVRLVIPPPGGTLLATASPAPTLLVASDSLPDPRAQNLRDQLLAGRTLLFALKNEAAAPTLARLLARESVPLHEARPNGYALLAEIDFRHPLFTPFADPRFSDFTKIHFWHYRQLDATALPGARVIARFDGGDPALLEVPVGAGRLLILTTGWHPADSQLALSTKFVPLLYSILEYSGAAAPLPTQYHVGDLIPLAAFAAPDRAPLTIRSPDGTLSTLPAGETNFTQTTRPGLYTAASTPPVRFAVNLDPAESRTAPLAVDELERLGVPISHPAPAAQRVTQEKVQLQNAELESRQKLWRLLLVATLLALLMETWLAGRTARRTAMAPKAG